VNRSEIIAAISVSIAEVLREEPPGLAEDTRLFDDLHLDSTSVLELLMAVEDSMSIEIDPESLDMENFRTVGTLADYLQKIADVTL
jgi:acyl carrier protein